LKQFRGLLPVGWTVIVLVDRSLYAKWIYEAIVELKWHPFLHMVKALSEGVAQEYQMDVRSDLRPLGFVHR
jgi:hypothetical protein